MKTFASASDCRNLLAGVALAAACLLAARPACATTRTVTTLADDGSTYSLRTLITASLNGDTIDFYPGLAGIITLNSANGALEIGRNLTITGPGESVLAISGGNKCQVLNISSSTAMVNISGLDFLSGSVTGAAGTSANPDGGVAQGGGIFNAGNLTLSNCAVGFNTAVGGAGYDGGSAGADGSGGEADGGGIYSTGALTLINCDIGVNSAAGGLPAQLGLAGGAAFGGGICSLGTLAMTNCTVSANTAAGSPNYAANNGGGGNGGGISIAAGSLVNCTIAFNTTMGGDSDLHAGNAEGGGLLLNGASHSSPPVVTLISCTISGNTNYPGAGGEDGYPDPVDDGDSIGGGLLAGFKALMLENTIVSGNDAVAGYGGGYTSGPDVDGVVLSGGFNLIGETNDSFGWTASGPGTDQTGATGSPINPLLGPLQNNGGPTLTMALPSTSPAVNQGKSFGLTTDQRGFKRPVPYPGIANATGGDYSDIGAFELSPPLILIFPNPQHVGLAWSENGPMMHGQIPAPMFGVQVAFPGNPSISWTNLNSFVRPFGNLYVARDEIGPGPVFYELSTRVKNPFVPGPATLMASNITATSATLCGTDIPVGSNTLYWFEYGLNTNYGLFSPTNSVATSTNPASLTCPIYGLAASTNYHCQLVVADDWGTQYGGDTNFTTASAPPPTPPVLVTLAATSITATSAVLNATIDAEGSQGVGLFQYGTNTSYTGGQVGQYFTSYDNDVETYSFVLTNLTPNTTYDFQALGYNCCAEGYGANTNFTTAAATGPTPPALVTLAATSITATSAVLNATIDDEGSPGLGRFQYGTNTSYTGGIVGSYFTSINNDVESYSYTLTNLTPNTTYDFQALGYNCCVEGFGANTNFTTAGVAPPPPTLISPGTNTPAGPVLTNLTPLFAWTAVSQAADYDLIISQSPYGSGNTVFTASVGGTSYQLPGGILQGGTAYAWHMIAFDSYGDASADSVSFYFQTPSAPLALTGMATNISITNATLQGFVYPDGAYTTAWFEYGTNTSYGTTTTPTGIGTASQNFSATIRNLNPRTVYYFRLDATNIVGTSQGTNATFETSPIP